MTGTNVRFQSGLAAAPVVCLILKHHKATTFSVYGTRTRDIVLSNLCVQAKLEEVKKTYGDAVKDLEPMTVTRPPKTEPAKKKSKQDHGSDIKESNSSSSSSSSEDDGAEVE